MGRHPIRSSFWARHPEALGAIIGSLCVTLAVTALVAWSITVFLNETP
jgi:hypothetical protein